MTIDPYKILGVSKEASSDEIRRAYRKLATRYHPDRNEDDTWIFQQIQEAYAILIGDEPRPSETISTQQPPQAPTVDAPEAPPPSDREPVESPVPNFDVRKSSASSKYTRRVRKKSSNQAIIIGTLGGALSAMALGYFLISNLGVGQSHDSLVASNSDQPSPRSSPKKLAPKKNRKRTQEPIDNSENDENKSSLPIFNVERPETNIQSNPDSNQLDQLDQPLDPQTETPVDGSGFWAQLDQFANRFFETDEETIKLKRHDAQRQWMEDLRDALDGKRESFRLNIQDVTMVRRGFYEVAFSTIDTGSLVPDFRMNIDPLQKHVFRKSESVMKKVGTQTLVEMIGNVYVSGPDKQIDLTGKQYMGVFRLSLRGRHENVEIAFALRKPTVKFIDR